MNLTIMPVGFTTKDFKVKEYKFDFKKFGKNLTNDKIFSGFRGLIDLESDNYIAVMPYFKDSIDIAVYHEFATDEMEYEIQGLIEDNKFTIEEVGKITDALFATSKRIRKNIDKMNVAVSAKYIFTIVSENEIYLKDSVFMTHEDNDMIVESLDINKKYMIGAGKKDWIYPVLNIYSKEHFYKMVDLMYAYQDQDIMIAPYSKKQIVDLTFEFNEDGDFVTENKMILEFSKYDIKKGKLKKESKEMEDANA